jgi:hypothetical protein
MGPKNLGADMNSTSKKQDVEWNKDGRPVNWNGRNWPLFSRTMKRYLACYDVAENEWPLDDICDGTVTYDGTNGNEEEKRFLKQELLLAKLISSSLSCTLAQQVMRFDYGSEMWEYLAARFEGRENEMTTLYTQRVLRQKLEDASCRPGADVENHLLYMMGLREQLMALDADVSDAWMVDFMVRSISQLPYYKELKVLMLTSGLRSARTPEQVKSVILVLEKEELVEKQLQSRVNNGSGNQGGSGRGNSGKQLPNSNGDVNDPVCLVPVLDTVVLELPAAVRVYFGNFVRRPLAFSPSYVATNQSVYLVLMFGLNRIRCQEASMRVHHYQHSLESRAVVVAWRKEEISKHELVSAFNSSVQLLQRGFLALFSELASFPEVKLPLTQHLSLHQALVAHLSHELRADVPQPLMPALQVGYAVPKRIVDHNLRRRRVLGRHVS